MVWDEANIQLSFSAEKQCHLWNKKVSPFWKRQAVVIWQKHVNTMLIPVLLGTKDNTQRKLKVDRSQTFSLLLYKYIPFSHVWIFLEESSKDIMQYTSVQREMCPTSSLITWASPCSSIVNIQLTVESSSNASGSGAPGATYCCGERPTSSKQYPSHLRIH